MRYKILAAKWYSDYLRSNEMRFLYLYYCYSFYFPNLYTTINTKYCREKIKINQHIGFLCSLSAPLISCPPVSPLTLIFANLIVPEGTLFADYSPYHPCHPYHHICFFQDYAEQKVLFCYSFETRYTFFVLHEVFESLD